MVCSMCEAICLSVPRADLEAVQLREQAAAQQAADLGAEVAALQANCSLSYLQHIATTSWSAILQMQTVI